MGFLMILILFLSGITVSCERSKQQGVFDLKKDLLLLNYDCKTDVDDLESAAAFRMLLTLPDYSGIRYHVVAGTYGTQEGLYVPPDSLFAKAFGDHWTDAHRDRAGAVGKVKDLIIPVLNAKGDIWIAEAGQSDFSASLVRAVVKELPGINTQQRIHIVQHSDWNEEVTPPEQLDFVKEHTDYVKIPDGNAVGNGTPGFRNAEEKDGIAKISDPELQEIWQITLDLCRRYNGQEGRYLNEAIAAGGVDFSDFVEVCHILGITNIGNSDQFFEWFRE